MERDELFVKDWLTVKVPVLSFSTRVVKEEERSTESIPLDFQVLDWFVKVRVGVFLVTLIVTGTADNSV
jgi:hypothetical protein